MREGRAAAPARPGKAQPGWIALVVLESALWGVGNPVMKIALQTLTPLWCLALRFSLAFALFALFFGAKTLRQLSRSALPALLISGGFNAATYILAVYALVYASATVVGFLTSLASVFTPVLSFFFIRRHFDKRLALIVALVTAGVFLLCGGGAFSFGAGEVLGILCSLSFAAGLVFTSRFMHGGGSALKNLGPAAVATVQVGVMAAVSLAFALALEDGRVLWQTPAQGWAAIVYMALGCTFAAYLIQNFALKHVPSPTVALAFSCEPVFTAAAAALMLGERLTAQGLIGAALVVLGIVWAGFLKEEG